ncbi:MAG TPA: CPBP family intramembrane metalloprotease [Brevefilum fermentans]|jgi:membrane protease YdiL (CAAX protease family)|uniref:Caax amino terminal protease n=1 Tax=Candidatus Brevifilum fermentans TaxID=1986204 RepID=A0A1Y6K0M8_9CHLR|nr:CPBP family intramembrane glutamic endopeptidase [Brevefilum fermentans]SMX53116.1 Caax amino terminal protease [Brevefilum fermentans]HOM67422.1 CPBP family intramembrane metalloprotease [Brevefilum fermentans]
MIQKNELNRVYLFLTLTFGISWATALVIYLTGGLEDSPFLNIANIPVSLALLLMATFYMFGPALANIITRVITKESKQNLYLKPDFSQGRWLYFLAAWLLPGLLTIIGMVVFFVLFSRNYDSNLSLLTAEMKAAGAESFSPWFVVAMQALQATLIAPVLNALPSFGEEFGWRGYLLPKLLPLGGRKASLITGVIWGVWHWPLILMGYNYGSDYFGAPFLGPLAMAWFCVVAGIVFGWTSIKADSIWPAVIGHGALNGIAALGLLFVQGEPNALLGPTPVGLIGGAGFTILAVILFLIPNAFEP